MLALVQQPEALQVVREEMKHVLKTCRIKIILVSLVYQKDGLLLRLKFTPRFLFREYRVPSVNDLYCKLKYGA